MGRSRPGHSSAGSRRVACCAERGIHSAAIPGKPDITTSAASQSRPLFTLADFQRFRGQRAQLTFRNAVAGRCNLVGELLGAEAGPGDDSEPFAIILDETQGERLHAPLSQLQLGEATALVPTATTSQSQRRRAALASALSAAAAKAVEAALAAAPIVAFVGADCALELLHDAGCAGATLRVFVVDRHLVDRQQRCLRMLYDYGSSSTATVEDYPQNPTAALFTPHPPNRLRTRMYMFTSSMIHYMYIRR